ncbi:MAG: crossover junction endodeoxyribonuclease RuvC [Bryobacteraceae bacterium]|nr:MAG: crossover junction endodeoxyribonuclease RuvC [Bryobacteraceae bacterium]
MRILGIDCGSQATGYGVIDTDGTRHRMVACGAIRTDANDEFSLRLRTIGEALRRVIVEYGPEEAAVEDTFTAENVRSALKLTHVRGVALFICAEAGLPVAAYPPAQVKLAVVGNGRAAKHQVQWMTRVLLGLQEPPTPLDASDALAVAICHAARRSIPVSL